MKTRFRAHGVAPVATLLLFFAALGTGCKAPATDHARTAGTTTGTSHRNATVVTIQTSIQTPAQAAARTITQTLTIAGDRARSSDDLDSWRLFDLAKKQVTFVDDIARTYRTESFDSLAAKRRATETNPLPDRLPRAQYTATGAKRVIAGVDTTQSLITMGGYKRELWFGKHPSIPPTLFAMMVASQSPASPVPGIMKSVDDALLKVDGYPFADHSELPYGNQKLVVDRTVVRVEQRQVDSSLLDIAGDYRDLTPKPVVPSATEPGAGRPSGASPARDRKAPAAG